MLKIFNELEKALNLPLIDINAKNIDYDNIILFELDEITKQRNISNKLNEYGLMVNLYYVTKESDQNHNKNSLNILSKLELHNAKAIQNITCSKLIIINATKYLVTKYDLIFEATQIF